MEGLALSCLSLPSPREAQSRRGCHLSLDIHLHLHRVMSNMAVGDREQWGGFWSLHKRCESCHWLLMREGVMSGPGLGPFALSPLASVWFGFTIIPFRHRQMWAAELFLSLCPRCLRAEGTCWITVCYKYSS